jgi:acetyl esterase/lipase
VVYAHGGGMVLGTLDLYDEVISWYVAQTGVPFLPVGYRRAPDEAAGTTLSEDVFAGLTWLLDHASALGVDPARVAVMGDSGGGAPAAGAAIAYARNLARAGIPIELHVHPGVPHGWERFAPNSRSARRAMADRARAIASL